MSGYDPVVHAISHPEVMFSLDARGWNRLLRRARHSALLARLAALIDETDAHAGLDPKVKDHLDAARAQAAHHERAVRWEINRVLYALRDTEVEPVLLKGAAYILADLPPRRGRLVSDVDILVPKRRLPDVERALLEAGWWWMKLEPYDQRYYRTWMHELPPLRHRERRSILDVHHTILPESGRLKPDPDQLFAAARPLQDGLRVLAPEDMVLHSAAHLFQDGDLAGGIRDLTDLDSLLVHFGSTEPGFWGRLVPRAVRLDLQRPLFYALYFCRRLIGTQIPVEVVAAARIGRPIWPVPALMSFLASRALIPQSDEHDRWGAGMARWLLYIRSHWMRMPPWLLTRHLIRKALQHSFPSNS